MGILLGIAVFKLENIESMRGDLAGWLLLTFGLLYFIWGVRQAFLAGTASSESCEEDSENHHHHHSHGLFHTHLPTGKDKSNITPWVLFTIFLFGPCEPLIPLLMYPAAEGSFYGVIAVSIVFAVVTIFTMTAIVAAVTLGVGKFRMPRISRYGHAIAGLLILLCGLAVTLGL
jgi:threonine/homoserine/homoserine lactone efflux protein